MDYTQEQRMIKSAFADKLLKRHRDFDLHMLTELLDILDEIGVPDMYAILKELDNRFPDWIEILTEQLPSLNLGTYIGSAKRIKQALSKMEDK